MMSTWMLIAAMTQWVAVLSADPVDTVCENVCTCGSQTCVSGELCHESASNCEAWAAVKGGQATDAALDMNLCWQGPESVHCPENKASAGVHGVDPNHHGISLPIDAGAGDFTLLLSFKLYWLASTAASVEFSSGENIGLDGGSQLFMEGGSWGSATAYGPSPSAGEIHTLILTRTSGMLTIALDGEHPFPTRSLAASIDRVHVRPWRNKVEVFEFTLMEACNVDDGTSPSTNFPCTCGTGTCMENALCFAYADTCQCPAGTEVDVSAFECAPCPHGEHSRPGEPCLPVLQHAVDGVEDPLFLDPVFDDAAVADDDAAEHQVTLIFSLGSLPLEIYEEGLSIEYRFDIQGTADELRHDSACSFAVDVVENQWQATKMLTYDDLSGQSCHFLTETTDSDIIRSGHVGVFVVLLSDGAVQRWERMWEFPVSLTFPKAVELQVAGMAAMEGVKALEAAGPYALGDFASTLTLTEPSDQQSGRWAYGETVQVTHALDRTSSQLDLAVVRAYLSNDNGVTELRDLTHVIAPQTSGPSEVIFTFSAGRCDDPCVLVVASEIVHLPASRRLGDRRLQQDLALHAIQAVYVKMPTGEPEAMQVSLTMVVQGIDYHALVARPSLKERFVANLRGKVVDQVGDHVGEDDILVTLSPGSVQADVVVRAHPDTDILAVKTTLEDPAVQSAVREDVTQSVAAMEDVHLISNGPISTELTFVGIVEVPPEGSLRRRHSNGVDAWAIAVVVTTALLVIFIMLASVCFLRRRAQRKQQQYTKEDVAVCGKDIAPMDAEVKAASADPEVLHI